MEKNTSRLFTEHPQNENKTTTKNLTNIHTYRYYNVYNANDDVISFGWWNEFQRGRNCMRTKKNYGCDTYYSKIAIEKQQHPQNNYTSDWESVRVNAINELGCLWWWCLWLHHTHTYTHNGINGGDFNTKTRRGGGVKRKKNEQAGRKVVHVHRQTDSEWKAWGSASKSGYDEDTLCCQ